MLPVPIEGFEPPRELSVNLIQSSTISDPFDQLRHIDTYVLPMNILSLATLYIAYILFWTILISVVKLFPTPGLEPGSAR